MIFALVVSVRCYSQTNQTSGIFLLPPGFLFTGAQIIHTDSGFYIIQSERINCKDYLSEAAFYPNPAVAVAFQKVITPKLEEPQHIKFLTIHGNISYEFFYRSAIDTPISQKDFRQHTERVSLDVTVKEKYPLKVSFVSRQSNSPYFRNFFDANFQFDRLTYQKNIKQDLINRLNAKLPQRPDLKLALAELKEKQKRYDGLKSWLKDPANLQKLITERERKATKKVNKIANSGKPQLSDMPSMNTNLSIEKKRADSLEEKVSSVKNNVDSTIGLFSSVYSKKQQQLDSLGKNVQSLQRKVDSIKNASQNQVFKIKQKIYKATSEKELKKIAAENGIAIQQKGKLENRLSAIKNFSIGRSILNYTELTAQNITVTGVNIEYNPSYYVAFAAGKIDYRFRDFFNKNAKQGGQYIVLGRFGLGDKEKHALIFTMFRGRKNQSDYALPDSIKNYIDIVGYSVEAILKKDENTSISAEFAKSTKPVTGALQGDKQNGVLLKFSDQTNMGINFKAQTIIPETQTRLSGFFRKTGENFQSFSLFSYDTDQTAWLARIDQAFLKNKITLTGMFRQNDFTNPFTEKTYKTTTVFKSLLLNVRFPKYPSFSIGYYPGTQLYFIDKERIRENAYYIINGSLVYNYYYKNIGMNSSAVFNRYINKATDSGFVLYSGTNYYASQTVFLKRLQIQAGYSYTRQPELDYYTLETSGAYTLRKWLNIGAGAKYNKLSGGSNYWGERIQLSADFKHLGGLQFQYEKSYLPTINRTLYPVEIGRVSWYKYF